MEAPGPSFPLLSLFHVTRIGRTGYDEYSDFICSAPDHQTAQEMHPNGHCTWEAGKWREGDGEVLCDGHTWVAEPSDTNVVEIGLANAFYSEHPTMVCHSFNAG